MAGRALSLSLVVALFAIACAAQTATPRDARTVAEAPPALLNLVQILLPSSSARGSEASSTTDPVTCEIASNAEFLIEHWAACGADGPEEPWCANAMDAAAGEACAGATPDVAGATAAAATRASEGTHLLDTLTALESRLPDASAGAPQGASARGSFSLGRCYDSLKCKLQCYVALLPQKKSLGWTAWKAAIHECTECCLADPCENDPPCPPSGDLSGQTVCEPTISGECFKCVCPDDQAECNVDTPSCTTSGGVLGVCEAGCCVADQCSAVVCPECKQCDPASGDCVVDRTVCNDACPPDDLQNQVICSVTGASPCFECSCPGSLDECTGDGLCTSGGLDGTCDKGCCIPDGDPCPPACPSFVDKNVNCEICQHVGGSFECVSDCPGDVKDAAFDCCYEDGDGKYFCGNRPGGVPSAQCYPYCLEPYITPGGGQSYYQLCGSCGNGNPGQVLASCEENCEFRNQQLCGDFNKQPSDVPDWEPIGFDTCLYPSFPQTGFNPSCGFEWVSACANQCKNRGGAQQCPTGSNTCCPCQGKTPNTAP